jgi:hydrogenase small subunit
MTDESAYGYLRRRGLSRRDFLKLCGAMAALAGYRSSPLSALVPLEDNGSALAARRIAEALQTRPRVPLIWLQLQDCAGCTEGLTRSRRPAMVELILDAVSIEYHETLSAAAGHQIMEHRHAVMDEYDGEYLLVVEGSVPGSVGACTVAGLSVRQELLAAAAGAKAVVAVGNCAAYGGIAAAAPNPTGAKGVRDTLAPREVICVPGCPAVPEVTAGVLVNLLALDEEMELDELGRPTVYYGSTVHDRCERQRFFRQGKFAQSFDDDGARRGWCLLELGCRGPETYNACPVMQWGDGLSYPVGAGHPCLGCSEPGFWDRGGFYPWTPRPHGLFVPWATKGGT